MKWFSTLTLILTIALLTSACGVKSAPAAPTTAAVDIQASAVAAAFTMVAQTQAALPTATPLPPTPTITDTPLPTNTVPPLPPSGATRTPAPGAGDPCVEKPMPTSLPGETVKVRVNNSTRATLAFSVYLNQTTPQGACGYRTYTIAPQEALVINDLVEGCYTLWAWNPVPEDYFIVTNGTTCMDNSVNWVFDISTGSIKLKQ